MRVSKCFQVLEAQDRKQSRAWQYEEPHVEVSYSFQYSWHLIAGISKFWDIVLAGSLVSGQTIQGFYMFLKEWKKIATKIGMFRWVF